MLILSELNFLAVKKIFMEISSKLPLLKKKYLRATHSKFVTKVISKTDYCKIKKYGPKS